MTDMAQFYLGAISGLPGKGVLYLRDGLMRDGALGIGATAANVSLIEDASGLKGFWTGPDARELRPTPTWLNRLVHFDFNDTKNAKSKLFISDCNGEHIGSAICPERAIPICGKGNSGAGPAPPSRPTAWSAACARARKATGSTSATATRCSCSSTSGFTTPCSPPSPPSWARTARTSSSSCRSS